MKAPRKAAAKRKRKDPRVKPGKAPGRGGGGEVKGGRKGQVPFVPTDAQRLAVAGLVSIGTQREIISMSLQIPLRTLFRHFKKELETGKEIIHARVGGGIVADALSGNLTARIFYAKAQMGWRDRIVGFADRDGKSINPQEMFTVSIV